MTSIERPSDDAVSVVSVADVILAGCIGCAFWFVGGLVMIVVGLWVCC